MPYLIKWPAIKDQEELFYHLLELVDLNYSGIIFSYKSPSDFPLGLKKFIHYFLDGKKLFPYQVTCPEKNHFYLIQNFGQHFFMHFMLWKEDLSSELRQILNLAKDLTVKDIEQAPQKLLFITLNPKEGPTLELNSYQTLIRKTCSNRLEMQQLNLEA